MGHRVTSRGNGPEGTPDIEATYILEVCWRVEVAGREPYEVQERRSGPAWTAGGGVGSGNRWYKVRLRPQHGLMKGVPVPCHVNPTQPTELWIDWDGAYRAHVPAWEREARIRRGVASRSNRYEAIVDRVINPLAGRPRTQEEIAEVERRVDRDRPPPAVAEPPHPLQGRLAELERIQQTGRKTRATVTRHSATDREQFGAPVVILHFSVEGREVQFEHCYGPRHLKHHKVGREVDVWVDPEDPDVICPGR